MLGHGKAAQALGEGGWGCTASQQYDVRYSHFEKLYKAMLGGASSLTAFGYAYVCNLLKTLFMLSLQEPQQSDHLDRSSFLKGITSCWSGCSRLT